MKKTIVSLLALGVVIAVFCWVGIGPYSSGSAVADLKAELESIYGPEYTGKDAENGTEDMVFVVEPKTRFLTNWNLRDALALDYEYECRVVFTTHTEEKTTLVRTITYQAVDPMGSDHTQARASLNLDSKTETIEYK